jgi:Uma2 family endonuclease
MVEMVKTGITQADLQQREAELGDDYWLEVENSMIVEVMRDMTWLHLFVIMNLFRLLDPHVRTNKLGGVYMDGARYVLKGTPTEIEDAPKPDFSFVRAGRFPADFDWEGDFFGAPDLAVEVISPGQGMPNLVRKLSRYLDAGTEEAWLIVPKKGELYQFRRDADAPVVYRKGDSLMTPLFPGLTIDIEAIFAAN